MDVNGTLGAAHGVFYQPPPGRGYSADDLQKEELRSLEEKLFEALPLLLDEGTKAYVAQIKQEQVMKALDDKLGATMSPDNRKRTHDLLRERAKGVIEAAAKAAEDAAKLAAIEAAKAADLKPTDSKAKVSK